MLQKKIENLLKKLLPINRYIFRKILSGTGLTLDYARNKEGVAILEAIFVHREYADYFPFLQQNTIVDIGAHYGYFSFFAAIHSQEKSRIFALEPSPENFKVFQENIVRNKWSIITAFNIALDGQSGERPFYGGPSFNHSFFGKDQNNSKTVPTLSLKHFIEQQQLEKIDFLKLDCEGAEFPILLAADADDLAIIQTIAMEFHDLPQQGYASWQLVQHLRRHGFRIVKYQHDSDYSASNLNFGKIIATKVD